MFGGNLISGLFGGFFKKLFSGLFGRLMGGGTACPAAPQIMFVPQGHKFWKRFKRLRTLDGCTHCDGTGAVITNPEGSPVPGHDVCPRCKGSGKDPDKESHSPPPGLSRRERKQWRRDNPLPHPEWGKAKWVRLPTKMCARGCGALNPVWEEDKPKDEPWWYRLLGRFVK